MRTHVWLLAFLCAGCGDACGGKKKEPARAPVPTPPVPAGPAPAPAEVTFKPPLPDDTRRFQAPRAEEVVSVSTPPGGQGLIAVTSKHAYAFGPDLGRARVVELPGVAAAPLALGLSATRGVVLRDTPGDPPGGKLYVLDLEAGKIVADAVLAGRPLFGAALAGGRFAVVMEPPAVAVYDSDARLLGSYALPAAPVRIEPSADGTWAAIASNGTDEGEGGGVVTADISGETPAFANVSAGPGKPRPVVALPVGDAVLVAGAAEAGRPFALVAPRVGPVDARRLAVGAGKVMGAARTEDGGRVAVFTLENDVARTWVFEPAAGWRAVGAVEGGTTLPYRHAVAFGSRLYVARCHELGFVDAAALTAGLVREIPSPQQGPCLRGLFRVGDRVAAIDARQVVAVPVR